MVLNQRCSLLLHSWQVSLLKQALWPQIFRNAILFRFLNLSIQLLLTLNVLCLKGLPKYSAFSFKIIPPILILSWHCWTDFNKQSSTSRNAEFSTRFRFKFPPAKRIKMSNSKNFRINISRKFRFVEDSLAKFKNAEVKHGRKWFQL